MRKSKVDKLARELGLVELVEMVNLLEKMVNILDSQCDGLSHECSVLDTRCDAIEESVGVVDGSLDSLREDFQNYEPPWPDFSSEVQSAIHEHAMTMPPKQEMACDFGQAVIKAGFRIIRMYERKRKEEIAKLAPYEQDFYGEGGEKYVETMFPDD